jgi:hypothetical protein
MLSRKLLFYSFLNRFNWAYNARFEFIDIFFINQTIVDFIRCLYKEHLISNYFFLLSANSKKKAIRIFFRYGPQQRLLFKKLQRCLKNNMLSSYQFLKWLKKKSSLTFPIIFFKMAGFSGILTDRQLMQFRLLYPTISNNGAHIFAIIKE